MQSLLAGLTFLIVGDSHFATKDYLITTLSDSLMKDGAKVQAYGSCGMPAGAWATPRPVPCGTAQRIGAGPVQENHNPSALNPSIESLIASSNPSVVVVGVGDPMAAYNAKEMPKPWIRDNVSSLTQHIAAHHLPCIWIGPGWGKEGGPYSKTFARVKEFSDYMATIVAPCAYIDSLTMAKPGEWATFDGQHYTADGYRRWGSALAQAIEQSAGVKQLAHR